MKASQSPPLCLPLLSLDSGANRPGAPMLMTATAGSGEWVEATPTTYLNSRSGWRRPRSAGAEVIGRRRVCSVF